MSSLTQQPHQPGLIQPVMRAAWQRSQPFPAQHIANPLDGEHAGRKAKQDNDIST